MEERKGERETDLTGLHHLSLVEKTVCLHQEAHQGALPSACSCDEFQVKRALKLDLLQLEEKE